MPTSNRTDTRIAAGIVLVLLVGVGLYVCAKLNIFVTIYILGLLLACLPFVVVALVLFYGLAKILTYFSSKDEVGKS